MRMAALCVVLSTLLLAGCAGGEVSDIEPAGVGAEEPDHPAAD
ncbi:MAG TPA: hypothetical protein VLW88_08410 [Hyphomicrobium sp.]|nr:hypothetical protein [Hyphomicrobium sp.]